MLTGDVPGEGMPIMLLNPMRAMVMRGEEERARLAAKS